MPSRHGTPAGHLNNQEIVEQRMPSRAGSQGNHTQNTLSYGKALPSTANFRNNHPQEEDPEEAEKQNSHHSDHDD